MGKNVCEDLMKIGVDVDNLLSLELEKASRMEDVLLYSLYLVSTLSFRQRLCLTAELLLGKRFFIYITSKIKR